MIYNKATMKSAQADDVNWFSSNKLHCNQDKTQIILLSLAQNQEIQAVK